MNKTKLLSLLLFVVSIILFVMFFISRNKQEYTVVFDSNGGNILEKQKVKYHEKIIKPTDPSRENYLFLGWYYNGSLYDFNHLVEENITLTANWQEKKSYEVIIKLEGEGYKGKVYEGNTINLDMFVLPPKEGFKIVFYKDDAIYDISTPVTRDLDLVAKYEKN